MSHILLMTCVSVQIPFCKNPLTYDIILKVFLCFFPLPDPTAGLLLSW